MKTVIILQLIDGRGQLNTVFTCEAAVWAYIG